MQDIYLVEDSGPVRERLEAMLSSVPGTRVVGHAGGAREAVSDILAKHPDVVLCDLNLKDGTGFDVLRALSAKAPEIECYMLSNFATQPYRRLAAELGARDFFDKSNEFGRVRDLVAKRAARQQTEGSRHV
jgi:DNA-binding NarL/FixJ family response regulator